MCIKLQVNIHHPSSRLKWSSKDGAKRHPQIFNLQSWQTRKKSETPSCLRRQASRTIWKHWIPAFAGMTSKGDLRLFTKPSIFNFKLQLVRVRVQPTIMTPSFPFVYPIPLIWCIWEIFRKPYWSKWHSLHSRREYPALKNIFLKKPALDSDIYPVEHLPFGPF